MLRRDFIRIMGVSSVGMLNIGCRDSYEKFFDLQKDMRSNMVLQERFINSVCQLCNAGCGIQGRVVNGDVIQIKGNPLSPLNRGKICSRGSTATQHLYNPDRIKKPMKLNGKRGSGDFVEIEWDEALKIVSDRLGDLQSRGDQQKLAMISGHQRGLIDKLFSQFFDVYGSPNYLKIMKDAGARKVLELMHGETGTLGFDLENANYILNFGANLFETSGSPVWNSWVYGYLNREREGRRAKLVHVDSIGNITAFKSDEWIQVNPCTSGALALGIAHILVKRNLYDSDFVRSSTFGFDDWKDKSGVVHKGFKTELLEEYDTASVSRITRVSIRTIERLAREFAHNQPGIALFDNTIAQEPGGVFNQMAVHSLNALMGNISKQGGAFVQQPIPYSTFSSIGSKSDNTVQHNDLKYPFAASILPNLLDVIENKDIDTLLLHHCNPISTMSEGKKYEEALLNTPFVVSFSSFLDETTPYCDLLLPEPTFLEKWQDVPAGSQTGFNQILGISKPITKPLFDTRHAGDVFLTLAQTLGEPMSNALPWENFENLLKDSLKAVFDSKTGMIFSGVYDKQWVGSLERSGWRYTTYRDFDEFLEQITSSGGWWNPNIPQAGTRKFNTPSGKFEFFSQILLNQVKRMSSSSDNPSTNDTKYMPHFEKPEFLGDESEFHLALIPFETGPLRDGAENTMPSLLGIVNTLDVGRREPWAEMSHATAEKFHLKNYDMVRIESPFGEMQVRLKITNRVVSGIIGVPIGLGQNDDKGSGDSGVNRLIGHNFDWISETETKRGTRVNIFRI